MNVTLQSIRSRLSEPSTWAGLSMLSLIFGVNPATIFKIGQVVSAVAPIAPADGGVLAHLVTAAAAGMAVVLGENSGAAAPQAQPAAAPVVYAQPAAAPVPVPYPQPPAGAQVVYVQAPVAQAPAAQPLTTG